MFVCWDLGSLDYNGNHLYCHIYIYIFIYERERLYLCKCLLQNTFIASKYLKTRIQDQGTLEFCSTNMTWFGSIWTELSRPLRATVPSHFIAHTSLSISHLFLPDTVNGNKFTFFFLPVHRCLSVCTFLNEENITGRLI